MSAPFPATTSIDQSRDWYLTVTYADSTGTPINITGYTAVFAMTQNFGSSSSGLTLSTGNGITITGSTGVISLHATAAQTSVSPGTYTSELMITSPAGVETSLLKGNLTVVAKVAP